MGSDGSAGRAVELELLMAGYGEGPHDEPASEHAAGLLRRAKTGDAAAFEQIIRLHEHRVFRTALRLLNRVEDAQDAAQEVYLRLYRHIRRLDERRDLAPWLYRLTVNVCRDLSRRRRKDAKSPLEDFSLTGADATRAGASAGPYEQAAHAEEWRLMAKALSSLPEKERAAVILRDLEGLTTREVAKILGSSETTVRSQVCRARLKLKKARERFLRGNK